MFAGLGVQPRPSCQISLPLFLHCPHTLLHGLALHPGPVLWGSLPEPSLPETSWLPDDAHITWVCSPYHIPPPSVAMAGAVPGAGIAVESGDILSYCPSILFAILTLSTVGSETEASSADPSLGMKRKRSRKTDEKAGQRGPPGKRRKPGARAKGPRVQQPKRKKKGSSQSAK